MKEALDFSAFKTYASRLEHIRWIAAAGAKFG